MDFISILITYILLICINVIILASFYFAYLVAGYFGITLFSVFTLAFIYYQYKQYREYND